MNVSQIINGFSFRMISDFIVDSDTLGQTGEPKNRDIIFCKTDHLPILFAALQGSQDSYVLISGLSDYPITQWLFETRPACIKTWFATNVEFAHPQLIPIPLGLENHDGISRGINTDFSFLAQLGENSAQKICNKIYCNFSLHTHHNRKSVMRLLTQHKISDIHTPKPFKDYWTEASNYLFIASPRGNGRDCHRTWEALLMGNVPIVEKHFIYDSFFPLPIIQVQNWEEVLSSDFLPKYAQMYYNGDLFRDVEKLKLSFWVNRIKDAQQTL